jgi:hypothetical protein
VTGCVDVSRARTACGSPLRGQRGVIWFSTGMETVLCTFRLGIQRVKTNTRSIIADEDNYPALANAA